MAAQLPSHDKNGQNGDLVVNPRTKKITILGRDMSYKDLANIVRAYYQTNTSMDIAVEVLEKREFAMRNLRLGMPFDEIVEKPLPQGRTLSPIDNFGQFSWVGHGAFSVVLKVRHRIDRSHYALKVIPNISTLNQLFIAFREVQSLTRLIDLHVVRYYTCWIESNRISNKKTESDMYDEFGFVNLNKIIKRYNLRDGESTSFEFESEAEEEEEEYELPLSNGVNDRSLALSDHFTQFTNDYLSKNPVSLIIQMELCSSNLRDWLTACPCEFRDGKSSSLSTEYRRQFRWLFDQIVLGLTAIHENSVIHRDIKPVNLFIHGGGEGGDFFFSSGNCAASGKSQCNSESCYHRLTVKIGDFGLSKVLDDPMSNGDEERKPLVTADKNGAGMLTANVGTLFYVAPEVISATGDRFTKYNTKADIYALGVVLLQMLHYCKTDMEMVTIIEDAKLPEYLNDLWPVEANLLRTMLSKDPNNRPSAPDIKKILAPTSEVIDENCLELKELRHEVEALKAELSKRDEALNKREREAEEMKRYISELEGLVHKNDTHL